MRLLGAVGTLGSARVSGWTGAQHQGPRSTPRQVDGRMDRWLLCLTPPPHCPGLCSHQSDHRTWPWSLGTLTFKGRSQRAQGRPQEPDVPTRAQAPGLPTLGGRAAGLVICRNPPDCLQGLPGSPDPMWEREATRVPRQHGARPLAGFSVEAAHRTLPAFSPGLVLQPRLPFKQLYPTGRPCYSKRSRVWRQRWRRGLLRVMDAQSTSVGPT